MRGPSAPSRKMQPPHLWAVPPRQPLKPRRMRGPSAPSRKMQLPHLWAVPLAPLGCATEATAEAPTDAWAKCTISQDAAATPLGCATEATAEAPTDAWAKCTISQDAAATPLGCATESNTSSVPLQSTVVLGASEGPLGSSKFCVPLLGCIDWAMGQSL
eukprot:TRINITY_DN665_c0_g1_i13.p3 TRINITY_DN665_c0_g1~~TRINITY_DN665_c0_g1_i13.p3  ORF type:complete len:159 (+),score=26.11 TRINITY_DN665_c0_g1_i13:177-653(+)